MPFQGWRIIADHLTNQQRLQMKAEHTAEHGDHATVEHQMDDGWSIKKLVRKSDFQLEGKLMDNCIAGYGPETGHHDVYSLRDPDDLPYVSFQMRRRMPAEAGGYWSRGAHLQGGETDHSLDTAGREPGTGQIETTQVLGRGNENPKEDYGKHLIKGLAGLARAEDIPAVSWNGGRQKTPDQLDEFLTNDSAAPPVDVHISVPVGMKTEDGGVTFSGSDRNDYSGRTGFHAIKVSLDDPGPQFGYHVFKTPFSEKRFERIDDLGTRLNKPDTVTGGWKIKTKPGDAYSRSPNVEGLTRNQVQLLHEAQTPDHVYVKMSPAHYEAGKNTCTSCGGQGKVGADLYGRGGTPCETCEGSGAGQSFSLAPKGYGRTLGQARPELGDWATTPDYDNHIVKIPFSEKNVKFSPQTASYVIASADHDAIPQDQVSIETKAVVPEKLYVAVPSTHRNNKYVYSEEGLEPTFLKNKMAAATTDRQNFVGSKVNDILEIDTSKLPEGALLNHGLHRGQSDRSDYNRPATHMWELNKTKAIPWEAITRPGEGGEHEVTVADKSEQNKRKQYFTPTEQEDGSLKVQHPAPSPVSHVRFGTGVEGKTVEAIKSLENGSIPPDIGTGVNIAADAELPGTSQVEFRVKNHPDFVQEVTPSAADIRKGQGSVEIPGGRVEHYDHQNFPSDDQRYFKLKQNVPQGHDIIQDTAFSEGLRTMKGDQPSLIPDTMYFHAPRRRRGAEDLYTEEGIDVSHTIEPSTREERGYSAIEKKKDLKRLWAKPLEGERNSLRSGEDPSEFDVWAVNTDKIPKAKVSFSTRPKNTEYQSTMSMELQNDCATCDADGEVYNNEAGRYTACPECKGSRQVGGTLIPWTAVKNLHRKPEEPTAPAVRRYFNVNSVKAYKHIFVVR